MALPIYLFIFIGVALLFISGVIILSLIPIYLREHGESLSSSSPARIAIIGAGISGLTAGLTLFDSGLFSPENIHIYDASNYIGGRMHTYIWSSYNQTSEWCGEFIDSDHFFLMNLTSRFQLSLVDRLPLLEGLSDTLYFMEDFYNLTQTWLDFQPLISIINEQLEQIGNINYNESTEYGRNFDTLSLHDWIEQYVPNGHQSRLGRYIDSAYTQWCGLDAKEQSCLNFLLQISPELQPQNGPLQIYGPSDERYRISGGSYLLPKAIADYLQNQKINIYLEHRLTKIATPFRKTVLGHISRTTHNKKKHIVQLTFSNGKTAEYDHIILTMPFSTLRQVDWSEAEFDELKQLAIRELQYGTVTKLSLLFSRRFWLDLSANGVIFTDLPFLNSWDATLGQQGTTGILDILSGGTKGNTFQPNEAFDVLTDSFANDSTQFYVQSSLKNLDEIWPNASSYYLGQVTVSAPWAYQNLLGAYACLKPGQSAQFHGYESVRQGNIHFAGDSTSSEFFGFMEGAVTEGQRAAQEIIDDYQ